MLQSNFTYLLPHLALGVGACLVLIEGLLMDLRKENHKVLAGTTFAAGTLALVFALLLYGRHGEAFYAAVVIDSSTTALLAIVGVSVMLGAALSPNYLERFRFRPSDYYTLLLISATGMAFLVSAGDLTMIFVGIETLSIAIYALTGYRVRQDASIEGALKYFLLGAFATGFLLYGMAFLYGASGTTNLAMIGERLLALPAGSSEHLFALIGLGLLLVGLAFKVGAVPFHMWVPDVYQGAPTSVTAFMSVAVKAAAFGILLRTVVTALHPLTDQWMPLLTWLAVATMIVGNLMALVQNNVKRMLAYSSVAHAGYLLLGVAAAGTVPAEASGAVIYYLLVYAFMNMGAFAVIIAVSPKGIERTRYVDLQGLSVERPGMAALLGLFMLALAGIPLTGGFTAKFYLFAAALRGGLLVPAVIGILASVVGVVYYLRVIVEMYMKEPLATPAAGAQRVPSGIALTGVIAVCAVLVVLLGLQMVPGIDNLISGGLLQGLALR